jgi:DNA-binding GntR family transcriptional regulator
MGVHIVEARDQVLAGRVDDPRGRGHVPIRGRRHADDRLAVDVDVLAGPHGPVAWIHHRGPADEQLRVRCHRTPPDMVRERATNICDNSSRRYDGPGRVRFSCRSAPAGKARQRVDSSAAAVRPIEPRSVVEQVMTELRRSILSGALAPGRELSLRELAEMLQVSIIPVREALRSLESEGLVVTRPGRSARVAPLDLDELRGLYRLRRRLEPEIAQRSCRLLTEADLDRLEQEAVGFGAQERTMNDIYDAHHEFHRALLAPAATGWDIRILSTLWRASERYIRIGWGRLDPDPQEHARREQYHVELVGAFRQRDPEVAAAAVLQHLSRNEQTALLALDPVRSPVTPATPVTPVS